MNKTKKRKAQDGLVSRMQLSRLEREDPKKQRRDLTSDIRSHYLNQIWNDKELKSEQLGVDFGTVGDIRKVFESGSGGFGAGGDDGDSGKIMQTAAQPKKVFETELRIEGIDLKVHGNPKGEKPDQKKKTDLRFN